MDPSSAPLSDDGLGGGGVAVGGGAAGGGGAVGGGGAFAVALLVLVVAGCLEVDACLVILLDRFGAGAMALGGGRSVLISVVG